MFAKSVRICRLQTTHWHSGEDKAVRGWGRGGGEEKKGVGEGEHDGHSRSNPNFSSPGRGEFQHIGPGNQHQQRLTDTPRHASRVKRLCTETGASGIPQRPSITSLALMGSTCEPCLLTNNGSLLFHKHTHVHHLLKGKESARTSRGSHVVRPKHVRSVKI